MKHLIRCTLLISTLLFGLLQTASTANAATAGIAAGKRGFVSYQVAKPLPLFTSAVDDLANAEPGLISTLLQLGTPVRITKGPLQQGKLLWWRVDTVQGDGWIPDSVTVNGKSISTLVPSTPDRLNSVIKALTTLIKTKPSADAYDSRGLAYLGLSFIGQVNYAAAASDFAHAVKLDPKSAWAYFHQAEALTEMNHYKDALASIDEALAATKDEIAFHVMRSQINRALEDYTAALEDAVDARTLKPTSVSALFQQALAMESMYNGVGPSPEGVAQQIVQADPGYADAWRFLARLATSEGDIAGAKSYYVKAIDAEPFSQAYISRGLFEINATQEFAAAEADLNQALKIEPNNARVYAALGYYYGAAKGDNKSAANYYNKAVKLNPYDTESYINLSSSYLLTGQVDAAITSAKQAIDSSPDLPCGCGYFRLGNAYYAKGDYKNALTAYQQFEQSAPDTDSETLTFVEQRIQELQAKQ